MGFWIFMLFCILLIPLTMLLFGKRFSKKAPAEINMLFGYRTNMSTKNKDTWEFAHKHFGKMWYRLGIIALPISALTAIPLYGQSEDAIGNAMTAIMFVQIVLMIIPIFLTESALKKNFDKDGNRK